MNLIAATKNPSPIGKRPTVVERASTFLESRSPRLLTSNRSKSSLLLSNTSPSTGMYDIFDLYTFPTSCIISQNQHLDKMERNLISSFIYYSKCNLDDTTTAEKISTISSFVDMSLLENAPKPEWKNIRSRGGVSQQKSKFTMNDGRAGELSRVTFTVQCDAERVFFVIIFIIIDFYMQIYL